MKERAREKHGQRRLELWADACGRDRSCGASRFLLCPARWLGGRGDLHGQRFQCPLSSPAGGLLHSRRGTSNDQWSGRGSTDGWDTAFKSLLPVESSSVPLQAESRASIEVEGAPWISALQVAWSCHLRLESCDTERASERTRGERQHGGMTAGVLVRWCCRALSLALCSQTDVWTLSLSGTTFAQYRSGWSGQVQRWPRDSRRRERHMCL